MLKESLRLINTPGELVPVPLVFKKTNIVPFVSKKDKSRDISAGYPQGIRMAPDH